MGNIRIGIIGTGAIASTHAGILRADDRVDLAQLYDIERMRAEAFAARFGGHVTGSVKELLDNVDAVYITTPGLAHAELSLQAVEAGKHVFCEKPFALNVADAKAIVAAVDRAGVVYQIGFSRRYAPVYQLMWEYILDERIRPRSFNAKMNRGELQQPPWTSDPSVTGGFLYETTLHMIDMVRFLLGEVRHVAAVGSKGVYPCIDNFSCIFAMENGAHGVFSSCAHTTWIFPFERVELYGEHSSIFNNEMDSVTFCLGLDQDQVTRRFTTLPIEDRWGFRAEDKVFIHRVEGTEPVLEGYADQHDGLRNVQLIEDIYNQIGEGR